MHRTLIVQETSQGCSCKSSCSTKRKGNGNRGCPRKGQNLLCRDSCDFVRFLKSTAEITVWIISNLTMLQARNAITIIFSTELQVWEMCGREEIFAFASRLCSDENTNDRLSEEKQRLKENNAIYRPLDHHVKKTKTYLLRYSSNNKCAANSLSLQASYPASNFTRSHDWNILSFRQIRLWVLNQSFLHFLRSEIVLLRSEFLCIPQWPPPLVDAILNLADQTWKILPEDFKFWASAWACATHDNNPLTCFVLFSFRLIRKNGVWL